MQKKCNLEQKPMVGVGLRSNHYPFLETKPSTQIDWFEAISENYLNTQGRPLQMLLKVREDYPMALHGVGMSIGSATGISDSYLKKLDALIKKVDPIIVSDHFCWSALDGHYSHDLLPFPFNATTLVSICENVEKVQNYLKRSICLENITYYIKSKQDDYDEALFINEVCRKTGCGLLLDINNIYVNSVNHSFNPSDFLDCIDFKNVKQLHLAGPSQEEGFLFDTHSTIVPDSVWQLLKEYKKKLSTIPAIVEWDDHIPDFSEVEKEAIIARTILKDEQ